MRIHTDSKAAESAGAVRALAFTVGSHVVFDQAQPSPETMAGRQLLAHELAHVVQQSRGGLCPAVHHSAPHEQEAEAISTAIAAGLPSIQVRYNTGVGLVRQPKNKPAAKDIDVTKKLSRYAGDPRESPRYIDNLFQGVTYDRFTGDTVFEWQENGKEHTIGIPYEDLGQDDTRTYVPIMEVHNSKDQALQTVKE